MEFQPAEIDGVFRIGLTPHPDERGFFTRVWCAREFEEAGIGRRPAQCSLSHSRRRGTLRGLHYQCAPAEEAKLIWCLRGAVWDVVLDVRPQSPTYMRWEAFELSEEEPSLLFLPEGVAHGFQSLRDGSDLFYMISEFYEPGLQRGVRFDDPCFEIRWPISDPIISERDRSFPDFVP